MLPERYRQPIDATVNRDASSGYPADPSFVYLERTPTKGTA
jgi:hypothetical protein